MESHKEWVRGIFDRASATYGGKENPFFDYFGEKLVFHAKPSLGDHILDVATGKGAVMIPAARAIGNSGRAVGIDLSEKMMAEQKNRASFPWVELRQMDAENLQFPDQSFDIVFCSYALLFFPNMEKALLEFKRVLKPKGKIAVAVAGKRAPLFIWLNERSQALGAARSVRMHNIETEEEFKSLLAPHFRSVQVFTENKTLCYENKEMWWKTLWSHGSRAAVEQLSFDQLEILKKEAFDLIATEPFELQANALLAIAEK